MHFNDTTEKDFCLYCGKLLTFKVKRNTEHIIPISRGGNNTAYNKRHSCYNCNYEKGDSTPEEYLKRLTKMWSKTTNPQILYELNIKIENTKYIIEYVKNAGSKLLKQKIIEF